jgi:hypothetical protein
MADDSNQKPPAEIILALSSLALAVSKTHRALLSLPSEATLSLTEDEAYNEARHDLDKAFELIEGLARRYRGS